MHPGHETSTSSIPSATVAQAQPGEEWGGFVFVGPGPVTPIPLTPGPAGRIANEELIPSAYPGTKVFLDAGEVLKAAIVSRELVVEPGFVPEDYQLVGAYVVDTPEAGVVDYSLAYRRVDTPPGKPGQEVFDPDLWIGWTTRAPQPLAVQTEAQDLEDGRIGQPYVKETIMGHEAVFQRWDNPPEIHRSLRINSALVWFDDDGRQWWVHAPESLDIIKKVAESLRPVS